MAKNYQTDKYFEIISNHAYNIAEELRSGLDEGYFDEKLVADLAEAFLAWRSRSNTIQNPYCVWHWNNNSWSKVTKDMYQEDAYKEWYILTRGGKFNASPKSESYYYLGLSEEILSDRHPVESEEDDFSIRYLLHKSFGE